MEQIVYMVRHKESGRFWKKGSSTSGLSKGRTPNIELLFTDKLGRARIFESEKIARNTLPSWYKYATKDYDTWETMEIVEIIPVKMVIE